MGGTANLNGYWLRPSSIVRRLQVASRYQFRVLCYTESTHMCSAGVPADEKAR
jgi:hypothetical protein